MSYELRPDETIGDGIQRIVCHEIEGAIHASGAKQNGKGSPVHDTRRHLKKARAALRLAVGQVARGGRDQLVVGQDFEPSARGGQAFFDLELRIFGP